MAMLYKAKFTKEDLYLIVTEVPLSTTEATLKIFDADGRIRYKEDLTINPEVDEKEIWKSKARQWVDYHIHGKR